MTVENTCECGELDGQRFPSERCTCGGNQVKCEACDTRLCRLCGRAPHPGYKCFEDRMDGDPSPPDEDAQLEAQSAGDGAGSESGQSGESGDTTNSDSPPPRDDSDEDDPTYLY